MHQLGCCVGKIKSFSHSRKDHYRELEAFTFVYRHKPHYISSLPQHVRFGCLILGILFKLIQVSYKVIHSIIARLLICGRI